MDWSSFPNLPSATEAGLCRRPGRFASRRPDVDGHVRPARRRREAARAAQRAVHPTPAADTEQISAGLRPRAISTLPHPCPAAPPPINC